MTIPMLLMCNFFHLMPMARESAGKNVVNSSHTPSVIPPSIGHEIRKNLNRLTVIGVVGCKNGVHCFFLCTLEVVIFFALSTRSTRSFWGS